MGGFLSSVFQTEYRIIYTVVGPSFYPLPWFRTYEELTTALNTHFNVSKKTVLYFDDASGKRMRVFSEDTFRALLPKHRVIPPSTSVYYIGLSLDVV